MIGQNMLLAKLLFPVFFHLGIVLHFPPVFQSRIGFFRDYIYNELLSAVGKDAIRNDSAQDPVPVTVVRDAVFGREGLHQKPVGHWVVVWQENHKGVEHEGNADAEEEGVVRPDRQTERLGNAERQASDQELVVANHEDDSVLVGWGLELEVGLVNWHVEGLPSNIQEEEDLEGRLDQGGCAHGEEHWEVEQGVYWHVLGQLVVGACPSLHHGERNQCHEVDVEELVVSDVSADAVQQRAGDNQDHRV